MDNEENNLLITKIKLQRQVQEYTLRELANLTGLSHSYINKIEQGLTVPSVTSLALIQETLNFSWNEENAHIEAFKSRYHKLYKHIIYAEYEMTHEHANKLYENREIYINSPCFIDYYLIMTMYIQHAYRLLHLKDNYVHILSLLEESYTPKQQELYLVQMGMYYHYTKHDSHKAIDILKDHLAIAQKEDLLAINYFILGMAYGTHYKTFKDAMRYFDKAIALFEVQNNFIRLMHIKTIKQSILIYLRRSESFFKLNQETSKYAKIKGEPIMYKESFKILAFYYMMQEQFTEALAVLNKFQDTHAGDYYFIKCYVLYRLSYHVEALHMIQSFKQVNPIDRHGLYHIGLQVIEHAINKDKDDTYITLVKNFADKAIEEGNYGMIRVSHYFVTKEFEALRRYKECFEYSHKLLRIIQTIVGREEDSNEARTI